MTGRAERRFLDRGDAGRQLAVPVAEQELRRPVVLALPRGGVPVAFEVARALGAPLEVFVARKVGAPDQREFGIGAIAEGGDVVADQVALRKLGITASRFAQLAADEIPELERRVRRYRGERALPDVAGRDLVIVDDGLATGVTAEAAVRALRRTPARRIILAIPACAPGAAVRMRGIADEVVCVAEPTHFGAVSQCYDDFAQTTDDEVVRLLSYTATNEGER
jgi:putative phosphoribosyl transferase